jgi:tRNA-modifying protein YgfZ
VYKIPSLLFIKIPIFDLPFYIKISLFGTKMTEQTLINSPLNKFFRSIGYNVEQTAQGEVIEQFSTPEEESEALYNGVGLIDHSALGLIELKGKDVLDFLHRISTNSVKELERQKIKKTIFTTEKGRIIDVATIMNFESHQLLVGSAVHTQKLLKWIDRYTIADDVNSQVASGKYALLQLTGPQAEAFLMLICGNVISELQDMSFRIISAEGAIFFLAKLEDHHNYWIVADIDNTTKIITYLNSYNGPFNFKLIGNKAWHSYRIEKGIPLAPNEINDNFNPHDAGIIDLVDFKKGCYIGQEVIARLDTYAKVKYKLSGFTAPSPLPSGRIALSDSSGSDAGELTSAVYSIKCKKEIALGYIRKQLAVEGTVVTGKGENGETVELTVNNLPFKGHR